MIEKLLDDLDYLYYRKETDHESLTILYEFREHQLMDQIQCLKPNYQE